MVSSTLFHRLRHLPSALWAVIFAIVIVPSAMADDLLWTTPLGTVTLFGSGDLKTTLDSEAALGDVLDASSLDYVNAASLPASARSEVAKDEATFLSLAQLSVTESQVSGLPISTGRIDFTGSGNGTGSGEITLYMLISVPEPVTISLSDVRSSLVQPAGAVFLLDLYQSDAAGVRFGDALLSFSGDNFNATASYQANSAYYLLVMKAVAGAEPGAVSAVDFSFGLDLGPAVAVPEPCATALLVTAGTALLAFRRRRRQ